MSLSAEPSTWMPAHASGYDRHCPGISTLVNGSILVVTTKYMELGARPTVPNVHCCLDKGWTAIKSILDGKWFWFNESGDDKGRHYEFAQKPTRGGRRCPPSCTMDGDRPVLQFVWYTVWSIGEEHHSVKDRLEMGMNAAHERVVRAVA